MKRLIGVLIVVAAMAVPIAVWHGQRPPPSSPPSAETPEIARSGEKEATVARRKIPTSL
jgi:hypothetical protein